MASQKPVASPPPIEIEQLSKTSQKGAGYDCDFVGGPPEEHQCEICMLTLRDPHLTRCCGRYLCQPGYERIRRDGQPCPYCREPNWEAFLNKGLQRQIASLKVHCSNRVLGCQWVGELRDLAQHSDGVCDYGLVECRNGCGERSQRHLLAEHETNHCSKRPIKLQLKSLTARLEVVITDNQLMRQEMKEMKEMQNGVLAENQRLREEVAALKLKQDKMDARFSDSQSARQEMAELRQEMTGLRQKEGGDRHTHFLPHCTGILYVMYTQCMKRFDHKGLHG